MTEPRPHPALYLLPNLVTGASILAGFVAMVRSAEGGAFAEAAAWIVAAMVLDVLDGRVARLTNTQSEFGVQFDSLADVISFGVAPAVLLERWALADYGWLGLLAAFGYLAAGAIRLARFNVGASADKPVSVYITGMPIPGGAGIVAALVLADELTSGGWGQHPAVVFSVVLGTSLLMLSTLPFRGFKRFRVTPTSVAFGVFALGPAAYLMAFVHPTGTLIWLMVVYVGLAFVEGTWTRLRGSPDSG